jgi:ATP-dependent Clp protease ATP-binding subunit ClpB
MMCSFFLQFKPEFLNRIDEYVVFNSLNKDNLRGIVRNEVKRLEGRLKDRDITMEISDDALGFIADIGFDPVYGARPLKRAIQRSLESVVAQGILRGEYDDGDTIIVSVKDERLDVRKSSAATEKAVPALNESVLE